MRFLIFLIIFTGCSLPRTKVPLGTIPKPAVPSPAEEAAGQQALTALTEEYELDYDHPKYDLLVETIERLSKAAGGDFQHRWHVYLLKAEDVKNAAATKGNHLFFWTGMLDFAKTEGEIATVAAHEMAHVLARHTSPDSSKTIAQVLIQVAAVAASVAAASALDGGMGAREVSRGAGALTQQIGNGIFVNPYSQEVETEADEVGLFLMSRAGYDPADAIKFWEKFADEEPARLSFFSTHPPAKERLERLKSILPLVSSFP